MLENLGCAHLNVRSLVKHFSNFKDLVLASDYDIIAVTETWLSDGITNSAIHIDGYRIVRFDRPSRGGGIAFYIKSYLPFHVFETDRKIEQLWLIVSCNDQRYAFGVVYNPHRRYYAEFMHSLESTFSMLLSEVKDIFCFGDFNVDLLDVESAATAFVLESFDAFDLTQIINEPTRVTANSATLLDYIVTSNTNVVSAVSVIHTHEADHSLLRCTIDVPHSKPKIIFRTYRDYKNLKFNQFYSDLRSIPWGNIYQIDDIDGKITFLTENLNILLDLHAPYICSKLSKKHAPWLTDTVKQMMRIRDQALNRFKISKNPAHFNYYKQLRNQVTKAVRNEKKAFYSEMFKLNSKLHWKNLKTLNISNKAVKNELPPSFEDADDINNYFIDSIPKVEVNCDFLATFYNNHRKNTVTNILSFKCVNENEISKIIHSIKTNSTGVDGLNIYVINLCIPFLLPYLTHIINYCIVNSVFPHDWKRAIIIPLPKKTAPEELKDLRPISILPTLSKIIERVLEGQLRIHLEINQVIPEMQSGFKSGHSCTTALLHVMDDVISATDQDKLTILVLLDYSKAFDTIKHKILLSLLHYIGLGPDAVTLFSNYLSKRYQAVSLRGQLSGFREIESGVPQGSILGPILFSIYISAFPFVLHACQYHFYADDCQLYMSFEPNQLANACQQINNDLQKLANISKEHSLMLNAGKSAFMLFGKRNYINYAKEHVNIKIDNEMLPLVDSVKSLGLTLDPTLRFSKHISKCLQGAYCNLRLIYQNRHILNNKIKTILCNSLVLSKVEYCDSVYGFCLDYRDINRIQKLQNACLRLIFGIRKYERISHKLKDIGWLNMKNRRILHCNCLYHKIIITKTPPYLYNKIRFRTDVHNLNLRFRGNITIPLHFTELGKRRFTYCIAKYYNQLPLELKTLSLPRFRHQLKRKLFTEQNT